MGILFTADGAHSATARDAGGEESIQALGPAQRASLCRDTGFDQRALREGRSASELRLLPPRPSSYTLTQEVNGTYGNQENRLTAFENRTG